MKQVSNQLSILFKKNYKCKSQYKKLQLKEITVLAASISSYIIHRYYNISVYNTFRTYIIGIMYLSQFLKHGVYT